MAGVQAIENRQIDAIDQQSKAITSILTIR